jgi:Zn-dependent protease
MDFGIILLQVTALFMALTFHEFAHAWTAKKLGDPTAQQLGRLTLNPKDHIDPFGTVFLPLMLVLIKSPVVFGWAKPVPINPLNFKNPRKGMMWSALGGPVMNILLAGIFILLFKLLQLSGWHIDVVFEFLSIAIFLNIVLGLLNLIPLPPLDGGRVIIGLLPRQAARTYSKIEPFGFLIFIGLLYFDILDHLLFDPSIAILRFLNIF